MQPSFVLNTTKIRFGWSCWERSQTSTDTNHRVNTIKSCTEPDCIYWCRRSVTNKYIKICDVTFCSNASKHQLRVHKWKRVCEKAELCSLAAEITKLSESCCCLTYLLLAYAPKPPLFSVRMKIITKSDCANLLIPFGLRGPRWFLWSWLLRWHHPHGGLAARPAEHECFESPILTVTTLLPVAEVPNATLLWHEQDKALPQPPAWFYSKTFKPSHLGVGLKRTGELPRNTKAGVFSKLWGMWRVTGWEHHLFCRMTSSPSSLPVWLVWFRNKTALQSPAPGFTIFENQTTMAAVQKCWTVIRSFSLCSPAASLQPEESLGTSEQNTWSLAAWISVSESQQKRWKQASRTPHGPDVYHSNQTIALILAQMLVFSIQNK